MVMAAVGSRQGHPPTLNAKDALGVQMLAYQIDGRHEQAAGLEAFIDRIERHFAIADELVELSGLLQARTNVAATTGRSWGAIARTYPCLKTMPCGCG